MTDGDAELYVICDQSDIAPGAAVAFSLARLNGEGEARPFPIVVIRTRDDAFYAYENICPHNRLWLNIGDGNFFSADGAFLECGRHGSRFEIDSGVCISGPCKDAGLESIPIAAIDGDVCLFGVSLLEAPEFPDPFDDGDDTMEIMIHPD